MTTYAIAQLSIFNQASYDLYQARFMEVFQQFEGRLLAADEAPSVIEGNWDKDKLVLMSFPTKRCFHDWAQSPEYRELSKNRRAGASAVVLLVEAI